MNALLNIGADRKDGPMVTAAEIAKVFYRLDVRALRHEVREPLHNGDELTHVVHVHRWNKDKAMRISELLGQDCIAQYDLDRCEGALIGPRADKWGEFNPQFFKLL